MSICEGGLIKISVVPESILNMLAVEASNWDHLHDSKTFDKAFGFHKAKVYYAGVINTDIHYSSNIEPVIKWVENIAGTEYKAIRCFLNLMEPNQSFNLHVDTLKLHLLAKRFHIPIMLGDGCTYYTYVKNTNGSWDELQHHMEYGYLYQLDNVHPHNVKNNNGYRINFICDVMKKDLITDGLNAPDPTQTSINYMLLRHGLALNH